MLRVFLGWDSRFKEPGRVLAYTLRQHSSVALDIRFLDARHLADCYGWRRREPDPKASTEFTYSRFLVPWLCDYAGLALFMDNDILCRGDIAPLLTLNMSDYAIRCVHHDYTPPAGDKFGAAHTPQEPYYRKLWSSVMLMNCSKLRCWTPELVATASGARLHRFQDVPDAQIAELEPAYNEVYAIKDDTKLFHYTEGGPYFEGCADCVGAAAWLTARREWLLREEGDPERPLRPVTL